MRLISRRSPFLIFAYIAIIVYICIFMKLARDDTYGTKKSLLVRRNEVAPLSPNMSVKRRTDLLNETLPEAVTELTNVDHPRGTRDKKLQYDKTIILSTKNVSNAMPTKNTLSSYNLVIVIPTTGRAVLCATLKTIELNSEYVNEENCIYTKTKIVVMSVGKMNVNMYHQNCKKYVRNSCFDFVDAYNATTPKRNANYKVIDKFHQKQTLDFISILQYSRKKYNPRHVLLVDDDSFWCELFAKEILVASKIKRFSIVHMGQGSSGILFQGIDIEDLTRYMMIRQMESNVDILIYKWAQASKKCRFASKRRWLKHKGLNSTFATTRMWKDNNVCGQVMPRSRLFLKFSYGYNDNFFSSKCQEWP